MLRFDSIDDLPEAFREQARKKLGGKAEKQAGEASGERPKQAVSKYRNRRCVVCGIPFASEMEGRRYLVLRDMLAKGEITKLKLQPEFTITESYWMPDGRKVKAMRYRADFSYEKSGEVVVEDVKTAGTKTRVFINKSKAVYEKFGVEITLVQA